MFNNDEYLEFEGDCDEDDGGETDCVESEDGCHCTCWYDGYECCNCGDGGEDILHDDL